ncbi:MAG: DUF5916 domain-containing protein [Acidobacteriota bacterium]
MQWMTLAAGRTVPCLAVAVLALPVTAGARAGQVIARASSASATPGQYGPAAEDGVPQVTVQAVRVEQPPILDGALDDEMYRRVTPATRFVQQYPRGGEPATDDTELWIFFDDRTLYVGVRCWDSRPDLIVANEMRRDNQSIWANDNVMVVFDTFLDRRTGVFFQTNPLGGLRDGIVIDENTVNYDWNAVWTGRSRRIDKGWTAEMAIPFKSLRYKPGSPQVWGIQLQRLQKSRNEQTLLSPVPRSYGLQGFVKLSSAARLVGIDAPPTSRHIEVKPYAITSVTTNRSARAANDVDAAIGLDAKYGVTSNLTADFTYNTDFAQVEIDEQQVNLTRYSLYFPEKRDFFLEGQGTFEFAGSGARRATTPDETPILFFSRRIGLNAGQVVPIRAGARLMGRAGGYSMGILNIQTEDAPAAMAASTNFTVARVKKNVFQKSSIGGLFTNRSPSLAGSGSNQVYGVDANLVFYQNLRISGYYARSVTPSLEGDASSYQAQFRYLADRYGFEAQRLKVGPAFSPEVGFLRRQDFRRDYVLGRFSPRPKGIRGVRRLIWEGAFDRYVNSRGIVETRQARGTFKIEFHSSDSLTVDYLRNHEQLVLPLPVSGGLKVEPGRYPFQEVVLTYLLGTQRPVAGTISFDRGGFYGGTRTSVAYTGRVRLTSQFAVEPRVSIDDVDLPQGHARVTLLGGRPTFTISPRMFVSALIQFNSTTRAVETNARWRWEYQPGSDIFVVYTDGRDTGVRGFPSLLNRGIAIKVTRFLRF